jgi:hypothetical protein
MANQMTCGASYTVPSGFDGARPTWLRTAARLTRNAGSLGVSTRDEPDFTVRR